MRQYRLLVFEAQAIQRLTVEETESVLQCRQSDYDHQCLSQTERLTLD